MVAYHAQSPGLSPQQHITGHLGSSLSSRHTGGGGRGRKIKVEDQRLERIAQCLSNKRKKCWKDSSVAQRTRLTCVSPRPGHQYCKNNKILVKTKFWVPYIVPV